MLPLAFADRIRAYSAMNPDTLDEIAKHRWWTWCNPTCVAFWNSPSGLRCTLGYLFVVFESDFPKYDHKLRIPGIYYQTGGSTKLVFTESQDAILSQFKRFCDRVKPGDKAGWWPNSPSASQEIRAALDLL